MADGNVRQLGLITVQESDTGVRIALIVPKIKLFDDVVIVSSEPVFRMTLSQN